MKNTFKYGLIGLGALGFTSAQAVVIDDFNGDTFGGNAPLVGAAAGTGSGGAARTVDSAANGPLTVEINQNLAAGVYSHSQDSGVTGSSTVSYALGGVDLTLDANAFLLSLINVDLAGFISIDIDGSSSSVSTTNVVLANGAALPADVHFLFSDFGGAASNANIVSITIDGTATAALDATIDNFGTVCSDLAATINSPTGPSAGNINPALCVQAPPPPPPGVPAPGSLALLGLGLLGLAARARKS